MITLISGLYTIMAVLALIFIISAVASYTLSETKTEKLLKIGKILYYISLCYAIAVVALFFVIAISGG